MIQWSTQGNSISPSSKTASASSPSIFLPSGVCSPTHSSKASSAASAASSHSARAIPAPLQVEDRRHLARPFGRRSPKMEATPSHQTQTQKPTSPLRKLNLSRLTPCGISRRAISNMVCQGVRSRSRTPSPNLRQTCEGCELRDANQRNHHSRSNCQLPKMRRRCSINTLYFRNLLKIKDLRPFFPFPRILVDICTACKIASTTL